MDSIIIRGARQHNLKNIDVVIPRNSFVVITGVSGSGKSSLAFDTIFAEGQRRYVESLSAYARQFLEQMEKPDVDSIEGLSPAISIEQKTTSKNPRSTVGTVTEIYDYLRLLWASVGTPHCVECGQEIHPQTIQQMVDRLMRLPAGTRYTLLAPYIRGKKGEYRKQMLQMVKEGFTRAIVDGQMIELSDPPTLDKQKKHTIDIVIDRLVVKEGIEQRLADSLEVAARVAERAREDPLRGRQSRGAPLAELRLPRLRRLGRRDRPAPLLVQLSLRRLLGLLGSRRPSRGRPAEARPRRVEVDRAGSDRDLEGRIGELAHPPDPADREAPPLPGQRGLEQASGEGDATRSSTARTRRCASSGAARGATSTKESSRGSSRCSSGATARSEDDDARDEIERFMTAKTCAACDGRRLKPEALAVTVGGQPIDEVVRLQLQDAEVFFRDLSLGVRDDKIAGKILKEVRERLHFLNDVGVGYLTLDRAVGDALGRGSAAHPPGDADRLEADGRPLRPGRAVDRPAPARQQAPHRIAQGPHASSATR